jgi:hypothetical protein
MATNLNRDKDKRTTDPDVDTAHKDLVEDEADRKNRDPISGTPGSHPVGVGVGAAAGGATGAAVGSVIPGAGTVVGAAVGTVVGAVAGGYAGKGVAEAINPTEEEAYWRDEHRNRPYYNAESGYDYDSDYAPAYRYGYTAYSTSSGRKFEDLEDTLRTDWDQQRGQSRLDWESARPAVRDAWDRADSYRNRPSEQQRTDKMGPVD